MSNKIPVSYLYVYLLESWKNKKTILITTVIFIIIFSGIHYLFPKTYVYTSSILLENYHDPFSSNPRDNNEWTQGAINSVLYNRGTLLKIAQNSGLLTLNTVRNKQDKILNKLYKNLTAVVIHGSLIKIDFRGVDKKNILNVIENATRIIIRYHNSLYSSPQVKTIVRDIDNTIAKKTSEIASLSTKYTKDHSMILAANNDLKELNRKRDQLKTFVPVDKPKPILNVTHGLLKDVNALEDQEEDTISKYIKIAALPKLPLSIEKFLLIVYLIAGTFFGFTLSVSYVLLRSFMNSSFVIRNVTESITGLPVLSRIPKINQ